MTLSRVSNLTGGATRASILFAALFTISPGTMALSAELPPELPLWGDGAGEYEFQLDREESMRSPKAPADSPTGQNRAFSFVSKPTYSIHRPRNANGVGLVICPGGGFRDVWLDREGHDLALRLLEHGVTCLVLKYRTRPVELRGNMWQKYQQAVQADGRQAVRVLRKRAGELGLSAAMWPDSFLAWLRDAEIIRD